MRDVIQHIRGEDNSYSDDSLFHIRSWGADLSFRELIERYDSNELVKPELQRQYVWDRIEASRFIDSLLLGLPVPSIFLAQTSDEKLLIIDGFQRIMTVYDFVNGIFSRDGKSFTLSRSDKINPRWRGKTFLELGEPEQRRIRNTTIHAIIFVQQHPEGDDTSLFQVFERINTSGRTLLSQEIRNCVAQGNFNSLIFELNRHQNWRSLYGLKEPDSRMRDMEFILRFFALSSESLRQDKREQISLKRFLDIYMKTNANLSDDQIAGFRHDFISTIDLIWDMFGKHAFHNISPTDPDRLVQKFSPTLFDSISIATSFASKKRNFKRPNHPEEARRLLLQNEDYRIAVKIETMTRTNISTRIVKACSMLYGIEYEKL